MLDNLELVPKFYPDFTVRIYIAEDCPALQILKNKKCELVIMPPTKGIDRTDPNWKWSSEHIAMFWRYFVIDELEQGDVVLFRDADSYLSERESIPTYEWIDSPYLACRFQENASHHNSTMMSGMWNLKGGALTGVKESIEKWIEHYKTLNHDWIFVDLVYNTQVLWPIIGPSTIGYGYGHARPLPPLKDGEFPIGEVMNGYRREEVFQPFTYQLVELAKKVQNDKSFTDDEFIKWYQENKARIIERFNDFTGFIIDKKVKHENEQV